MMIWMQPAWVWTWRAALLEPFLQAVSWQWYLAFFSCAQMEWLPPHTYINNWESSSGMISCAGASCRCTAIFMSSPVNHNV